MNFVCVQVPRRVLLATGLDGLGEAVLAGVVGEHDPAQAAHAAREPAQALQEEVQENVGRGRQQ